MARDCRRSGGNEIIGAYVLDAGGVKYISTESLAQAQAAIGAYIEQEYNRTRLHSSLGYRPPQEYERLWEEAADAA